MSNTPCAYAVSSVLHRRVEIKVVLCLLDFDIRMSALHPIADLLIFIQNKSTSKERVIYK